MEKITGSRMTMENAMRVYKFTWDRKGSMPCYWTTYRVDPEAPTGYVFVKIVELFSNEYIDSCGNIQVRGQEREPTGF